MHKFLTKGSTLFLAICCFTVLLLVAFSMNKASAITEFGSTSDKTLTVFDNYGIYISLIFPILALACAYILFGLMSAFNLRKHTWAIPAILIVTFGMWLWFAITITFFEPRYASVAIAIILFEGYPLLIASGIMTAGSIAALIYTQKAHKGSKHEK